MGGFFRGCKAAAASFILLNVIFFTTVSSSNVPCTPKSPPLTPSTPEKPAKCPKDTLKFGVCGSWLGLVTEVVGTKPSEECCTVVKGLADLEAALCLCTAIKANVLGVVKLEVPVALSLLVNGCGKKVPEGFVCA
ncbi:putative lipid-binding protein At4g00165 [Juglans microcarpa x Juglans regia]|uniref:putative lipid-binding protein At4g00165 n=1 Tax=Juglans microcarpa x Juglans regia TaxID=2249226 RepID=UPI001B7E2F35|nr:putative lipid-binding protein At4g00165 [Juglans microcarpa x Juglans regia]